MLIGIVGLISSGKGTVADRLVEQHGYKKDSFAKKFCKILQKKASVLYFLLSFYTSKKK